MGEKICGRCKVAQPLAEFYLQRGRPRNPCRTCYRVKVAWRRAEGLTQAAERARYARSERYRAQRRELAQRWRARNPEKIAANYAVEKAIRRGELVRQPCEVCGATAHAHHADYTRVLEVRWLCALHHMRQHVVEGRVRAAGGPGRDDRPPAHVVPLAPWCRS